jgi:hypothetical protein
VVAASGFVSPFAAAFEVPLDLGITENNNVRPDPGDWRMFLGYVGFSLLLDLGLIGTMMWLFNTRWRVAG